jgi:hypothetical protein
MAKAVKSKKTQTTGEKFHISLTNKNYMIIGLGIVFIIVGYIFLSENSVEGFLPTVLAPVFLVLGYCVVIPLGILFKDKSATEANENTEKPVLSTEQANIKTK